MMDFGQDKETKITLFGPVSGKNLFRIYPELSNYQAFKDLSNEELHYAWLIGIPGSPVDEEWDDASRRRSAASKAFKRDKDTAERYVAGEVPDKVKLAIKKFSEFSPDARLIAKRMTQRIFQNWGKLIDVDVENDFLKKNSEGEDIMDWTGRKQYVDSTEAIAKAMPVLLKQLEEGFGITDGKKSDVELGSKPIDKFHQDKKN